MTFGDGIFIGCLIGYVYALTVHPWWCRVVDSMFERWWP